ncbi:signal transduction histidine kinase [Staphylococcus saccharolyticus]|uniref:Signal transduction histidine kinase n=1 Tax=Staphylococcus saccharolyticus TaxID=33028 RepID=A0A380H0F2_9STAP|nr:signal transduction histidine kinase [Staphylococcus saccharolyticus]
MSLNEDYLRISVNDNGRGIPHEKLNPLGYSAVSSKTGTGNALVNLNKRLIGSFGAKSSLDIRSSNDGTIVSCVIPYKYLEEADINENAHR